MLGERGTVSKLPGNCASNGGGLLRDTFEERLRQLERLSKDAFHKSSAGSTSVSIHYAKEDYAAEATDQLSLLKGDRLRVLGHLSAASVLVSVGEEVGFVPSSVLALAPTEHAPSILTGPTKRVVRFKEDTEEIPPCHDNLVHSGCVEKHSGNIDDLLGIAIASGGPPPRDPSRMLRVYAGNISQELGGYRTLLVTEHDTMEQLTENAVQRFRLDSSPSNAKAYLTLENPDTHHALLLPDPNVTTLGAVIELAKRATWMQSPIPKGSSKGFKRLVKRIAGLQHGHKPIWHSTDNGSVNSDASGEVPLWGQPPLLGITRDPCSDFETGYRFYLNVEGGL